jgi:hypothetical protein
MAANISPDTGNYLIGKGIILFQPVGAVDFYHVGNVPSLAITPKTTLLDHFSSMAGTKAKDLTIVTEKTMEMKMQMEEFTARNLALIMLGDIDNTDPDAPIVNLFTQPSSSGHLKFYATNDVGPRWFIDLPSVTINPSGDLNVISDAFGSMEVTGSVNSIGGVWGTATLMPPAGTVAPENVLEPSVTGDTPPKVGIAQTANVGGWIGASSFTYAWKVGGTTPAGTPVNQRQYFPAAGDVGKTITVSVSGVNTVGSTAVTSDPTVAVVA